MSCAGCSTGNGSKPKGCQGHGDCVTGGCNRLNTYDWLAKLDISDPSSFEFVEVSFKNGASKGFFKNPPYTHAETGDMVVVDTGQGYDVGKVDLSGELVRLQMKKKHRTKEDVKHQVIRKANERDLNKMEKARELEHPAMIRARVIARTMGLEMKIGDVEYQADLRKATFYYTADGRVDFRELVRAYAKEFKIKIEMRQIGARQESGRIGGLGSCGRELCCSTWLTDFKSVKTEAARYQNLSINQAKLSGQCGRLKCCLNYELDTYMETLKEFPTHVDELETQVGKAKHIKTDIFKHQMYFAYQTERGKGNVIPLDIERVRYIHGLNKKGKRPPDLKDEASVENAPGNGHSDSDFADVTGDIVLDDDPGNKNGGQKDRKKGKKRNGRNNGEKNK